MDLRHIDTQQQIDEDELFQCIARMSKKLTTQKLYSAKREVGLTTQPTDAL